MSLLWSFAIVYELFCGKVLQTFVILIAVLLPVKSPVASPDLWIVLFKVVLRLYAADCLA